MNLRQGTDFEIELRRIEQANQSERLQRKVFSTNLWLIPDSKELLKLASGLIEDAVLQYSIHVDGGSNAAAEFDALVFSLLEYWARTTRFPQWDLHRKMLAKEAARRNCILMRFFMRDKIVFTEKKDSREAVKEWEIIYMEWFMNRVEIYTTVLVTKGNPKCSMALVTTYGLLCSYSEKIKRLSLVDAKNNQDILNLCLSFGLSGDALNRPNVKKITNALTVVNDSHIPMIISLLVESAKRGKPWSPFRRWFCLQVVSFGNLLRSLRSIVNGWSLSL